MPHIPRLLFVLAICAFQGACLVSAQEAEEGAPPERFRSRPVAVESIGRAELTVKDCAEQCRLFCSQGMAWLHGGDFRQADRCFFAATGIQPDCSAAWCGLALANEQDVSTAARYARRARELAPGGGSREWHWADALCRYFDESAPEHERRMFFIAALDRLVTAFPDDVEARAVLAGQMVKDRESGSMSAVTASAAALLNELLREYPAHPAHRYRLLLWLRDHPGRALESAEMIRRDMTAVPQALSDAGRLFAALDRLEDATRCFEMSAAAAARQIGEENVNPQEVSGWVENSVMLVRHLGRAGRWQEAAALARELIELPVPAKREVQETPGNAHAMASRPPVESVTVTGQRVLLELLCGHQQWAELEAAVRAGYLDSGELEIQARRCHAQGLAALARNDSAAVQDRRAELQTFSERVPPGGIISVRFAYRRLAVSLLAELDHAKPSAPPPVAAASGAISAGANLDAFARRPAPALVLTDGTGKTVALADLRGGPVVVVFYLGAGCPHCVQQLRTFAPLMQSYREAGIRVLAVSTDTVDGLKETFANMEPGQEIPLQLLSDAPMKYFRGFGAFDAQRNKPLHGIFLIDRSGMVRWRVTSTEPFMEAEELLNEARRTLRLRAG